MRQLSLVGFRWRRKHPSNLGAYRWTRSPHRDVVGMQTTLGEQLLDLTVRERERKYHPSASRMTSGSNCRHLNRPESEAVSRSIEPAYQITPPKLQHFLLLRRVTNAYGFQAQTGWRFTQTQTFTERKKSCARSMKSMTPTRSRQRKSVKRCGALSRAVTLNEATPT